MCGGNGGALVRIAKQPTSRNVCEDDTSFELCPVFLPLAGVGTVAQITDGFGLVCIKGIFLGVCLGHPCDMGKKAPPVN